VLQFNGWLFEGYDDAKTALMETIIDEIVAREGLLPKVKKIALQLMRRVNWFRVVGKAVKYGAGFLAAGPVGVGAVAGLDVMDIAKKAGDRLEEVPDERVEEMLKDESAGTLLRGVREFRQEFGTLLAESSIKKLVVIIDDLDRCLPGTVIETLEAIKLFLFVDHTAFILGADERLVKYAVRLRFPELPGERAEVGRDYLEKLIQFPVRVPSLGRGEMTNYVCHLFAAGGDLDAHQLNTLRHRALSATGTEPGLLFDFVKAASELGGYPKTVIDQLAFAQRIGPILGAGLNGNPRQCKRFLNTLVMRLKMAESRKMATAVEPRAMAKLMLLEYFKPASFRHLAELQAIGISQPSQLKIAETSVGKSAELGAGFSNPRGDGKGRSGTPAAAVDDLDDEAKTQDQRGEPLTNVVGSSLGELAGWIEDPWLRDWLAMEPALGDIDLRPYFYFSRDTLSAIPAAAQRLTPKAQEILDQVLQQSDAVRKNALKSARDLSEADAAAVFEELAIRTRREDNLAAEKSTLHRLLEWAGARPELIGQLVMTVSNLSDTMIPFAVVPALVRISKGTSGEAAVRRLLTRWKDQSENPALRQAAGRSLSGSVNPGQR
jgi:hypothetical protein